MTAIDLARRILADPQARIAVVGASRARHKYGNIILRDLRKRGYDVVAVNPHEADIEGIKVVATVAEASPPIHIINLVTPPERSLEVVEGLETGVSDVIWFQPGAYDDRVVRAARERFPAVLAGDCIMVVARQVERRS